MKHVPRLEYDHPTWITLGLIETISRYGDESERLARLAVIANRAIEAMSAILHKEKDSANT